MRTATVLGLNAASCIGFGLAFLLAPGAWGGFLGAFPPWLLMVLGVGLVGNGWLLLLAAARGATRRDLALFALGDAAWVLATAVVLACTGWISTGAGLALSLTVALFVGVAGVLQWQARRALG